MVRATIGICFKCRKHKPLTAVWKSPTITAHVCAACDADLESCNSLKVHTTYLAKLD